LQNCIDTNYSLLSSEQVFWERGTKSAS